MDASAAVPDVSAGVAVPSVEADVSAPSVSLDVPGERISYTGVHWTVAKARVIRIFCIHPVYPRVGTSALCASNG